MGSCRLLWYPVDGQDSYPWGSGTLSRFLLQDTVVEPLSTPVLQDDNPYEDEGDEMTNYKGEDGKRDFEQKQRLRHYCGKRKRQEPSNETLGHLYVFEKYKLIFCLVPKVASRQWMPLLGRYRTYQGYSPYGPTVKQFPPEKGQKMLETFYKFMFVREPFERLLSAYKDKYVHPRSVDKDPFITVFGRKIIQNFRPNASQEAIQSGYGVKWPEFVEYILNEGDKDDWHWANYLDVCGFCDIKYDYVGHYETMVDDAGYVLERANLTELKFPAFRPSKTQDELVQYYSQIPKSWIQRLGDVYQSSFEIFGYPFPGPLENLLGSS
ncbi:carbohydrate sulfotransferase 11-like isoform X2 [Oculina patagonica]